MYSKPEIGVQYTVAKHGKMNVRKIGLLKVDIPNVDNLPPNEYYVDIFIDSMEQRFNLNINIMSVKWK